MSQAQCSSLVTAKRPPSFLVFCGSRGVSCTGSMEGPAGHALRWRLGQMDSVG